MSSQCRGRGRGPVPGMNSRKLLGIALAATALYAGVLVASASAELHRVQVTLITGQVLTVTVDVPAGTPVQQVQIPGLPAPVQNIVDLGPVATATPIPTPTVPKVPDLPEVKVPSVPTPGNQHGGGDNNSGGGNSNTRRRRRLDPDPGPDARRERGQPRPTATCAPSAAAARRTRSRTPSTRRRAPTRTARPARPTRRTRSSHARARAYRRAELLHRQVPHPAVPAPDLPGRRHPVRRALGGPRGDQRDRDRLRPQPQRLHRRRRRLDAVHARRPGGSTASTPTATASRTRTTRSTRSSPPRATCAPPAPTPDIRRAIFAYNHADWYVDSVLLRAQVIGGLPADLVGSLTGLTQGRFPVQAQARRYAGAARRPSSKRVRAGQRRDARRVDAPPRHQDLLARRRPGRRRQRRPHRQIGSSKRLGHYVQLQDVYGNTYTYGHLTRSPSATRSPKPQTVTQRDVSASSSCPTRDAAPAQPASRHDRRAGAPSADRAKAAPHQADAASGRKAAQRRAGAAQGAPVRQPDAAERVGRRRRQQEFQRTGRIDGVETFKGYY